MHKQKEMVSRREKLKVAKQLFAYILLQLLKSTIIAVTGVRPSLSLPSLPAMFLILLDVKASVRRLLVT